MTHLTKPIIRKTGATASHYGRDANRNIVVTLVSAPMGEDIVMLHPLRCPGRKYAITVKDLWSFLQRCEANKSHMEKLRARKAAKAERLERARLRRSINKKD